MTLTLQVLRCPDQVFPELKRVAGGEFSVGRGPDNDWVLRDDSKQLSRKHCVFGYRNGRWMVADLSSSGVLINGAQAPLGRGNTQELASGDRLALGPYEIEIRLQEDAAGGDVPQPRRNAIFGGDFFSAAPDPSMQTDRPFDTPFGPESLTPEISMHQHFNTPPGEEWRLPVMPDHASPLDAAFNPAPLIPLPPAAPEAWNLDFPPGPPPGKTAPPAAPEDDWDLGFPAAGQPPPASASPAAIQAAPTPNPFDEKPFPPVAPEPFPAMPPPATPTDKSDPTGAGADALLVAFLEGAGMPQVQPPDALALMRRLGSALRATVAGIRQALIARATIKNEFRIEQTMIRARGNNPLKFSADDDDALAALLGLGRRADMAPDAALADALRDMRLHELATMIAVQDAVRALLAQLDPEKLQLETGGVALLPAQKKARAFEAYEKLHRRITQALTDDFDSVFGKAFANAYEAALRDAQLREPK
jgi:type VI secretion system protein ImpI/type VI secretion system protein